MQRRSASVGLDRLSMEEIDADIRVAPAARAMRVALDTNVLVAGLLSPYGPSGQIVRMVSAGDLTLCLDARILAEYSEVLRRPRFGFDSARVCALLAQVAHAGCRVASTPLPAALPDPDDEPFVEVAIAGQTECVIIGNRAHFPDALCAGVVVVSPRSSRNGTGGAAWLTASVSAACAPRDTRFCAA